MDNEIILDDGYIRKVPRFWEREGRGRAIQTGVLISLGAVGCTNKSPFHHTLVSPITQRLISTQYDACITHLTRYPYSMA